MGMRTKLLVSGSCSSSTRPAEWLPPRPAARAVLPTGPTHNSRPRGDKHPEPDEQCRSDRLSRSSGRLYHSEPSATRQYRIGPKPQMRLTTNQTTFLNVERSVRLMRLIHIRIMAMG